MSEVSSPRLETVVATARHGPQQNEMPNIGQPKILEKDSPAAKKMMFIDNWKSNMKIVCCSSAHVNCVCAVAVDFHVDWAGLHLPPGSCITIYFFPFSLSLCLSIFPIWLCRWFRRQLYHFFNGPHLYATDTHSQPTSGTNNQIWDDFSPCGCIEMYPAIGARYPNCARIIGPRRTSWFEIIQRIIEYFWFSQLYPSEYESVWIQWKMFNVPPHSQQRTHFIRHWMFASYWISHRSNWSRCVRQHTLFGPLNPNVSFECQVFSCVEFKCSESSSFAMEKMYGHTSSRRIPLIFPFISWHPS